ncbi:MAG: patatin-like phospholipase family protein [Myxococcota bacterium]
MRALVLGGGGAKGAYQVGALRHLLIERGLQYPIVAGTSVGALNGAYLAMFPVGGESEAASSLVSLWRSIDNRRVWRKWYGGLLGRLPVLLPKKLGGKQSAYSTAPLRKLVAERFDPAAVRASGRILRIGAVDLATGERKEWTEADTDELPQAVLASSSFPMFFEPVRMGRHLFTDDGVREISPVQAAIEAGATEVDVISTNPDPLPGGFDLDANGLVLGQRILDTMSAEIEKWDLKATWLYNALARAGQTDRRLVRGRVLRPSSTLLDDALDFDPAKIRENMGRGEADAKDPSAWLPLHEDPGDATGDRTSGAMDREHPEQA